MLFVGMQRRLEIQLKWGNDDAVTDLADLSIPNLLNTFYKYRFRDK